MGWLLSTSLVSGNTAVLERRRADTRLCQRNHKIMPSSFSLSLSLPPSLSPLLVFESVSFPLSTLHSVFPHPSSTWCPASPCRRTCPQRRPPTYLRHPPRPQHRSHPWPPCPRCRQYWEEQTSPVWEPCADATQTNTPCPCRQVGPTTQHCTTHRCMNMFQSVQTIHF